MNPHDVIAGENEQRVVDNHSSSIKCSGLS